MSYFGSTSRSWTFKFSGPLLQGPPDDPVHLSGKTLHRGREQAPSDSTSGLPSKDESATPRRSLHLVAGAGGRSRRAPARSPRTRAEAAPSTPQRQFVPSRVAVQKLSQTITFHPVPAHCSTVGRQTSSCIPSASTGWQSRSAATRRLPARSRPTSSTRDPRSMHPDAHQPGTGPSDAAPPEKKTSATARHADGSRSTQPSNAQVHDPDHRARREQLARLPSRSGYQADGLARFTQEASCTSWPPFLLAPRRRRATPISPCGTGQPNDHDRQAGAGRSRYGPQTMHVGIRTARWPEQTPPPPPPPPPPLLPPQLRPVTIVASAAPVWHAGRGKLHAVAWHLQRSRRRRTGNDTYDPLPG